MLNVNLHLNRLEASGRQIRVGIVGAGQMGAGLVAQISRMKGMRVVAVADIAVDRATSVFQRAGVAEDQIAAIPTVAVDRMVGQSQLEEQQEAAALADKHVAEGKVVVLDQAQRLTMMKNVDVVVEATGFPEVGAMIAELAIQGGKHVVMLNAETDATVGYILNRMAEAAGVVYTGAAGDEPAAAKELYDFATALGFEVLVAGKGKNNPLRVDATPDDLAAEALQKGTSPKMLTSFVDGTKTMVEMTQLANATGLVPDCQGMHGPAANLDQVLDALKLKADGGPLSQTGVVEFIEGIAPGVFVVIQSDQPVVLDILKYLKMGDGPRYLLYRPYHLTSLETPLSVARAVIYNEPTIVAREIPVAETVTVAKRDLKPGDRLDGLGGFTAYGTIITAAECLARGALPLGLAIPGTVVTRPVVRGTILTYDDVEPVPEAVIVRLRRQQDQLVSQNGVTLA